jgi:C-terminal processing protease CtpA/Prc
MSSRTTILTLISILVISSFACQVLSPASAPTALPPSPTSPPTATSLPTLTPTPLPPAPVEPGPENPDEPVFISGIIPYSSPFFLDTLSEAFVMLEDQAGFFNRDEEFEFTLAGQAIGPVELQDDETLTFYLALPAVPQGTLLDLDNDGEEDTGVQVFAVAYWSNTWGGPFLERRDGTGWSSAYASTITDPDQDYEIIGGQLVVWAPDDEQEFPTSFGEDGLLFTEDDPTAPIPPGYNLVDLDQEPFLVFKEAQPYLELYEGALEVNDYSDLSYSEAFDSLFDKVSQEYPFTADKGIDWDTLYDEYAPRMANARDDEDFYLALKDFTLSIPDGHVGISFNELVSNIFFEEHGGSFGLVLTELSDGRVIVTQVLPDTPGEKAEIKPGAEILEWDGQPITEAISQVVSFFGPYSTSHHERLEQLVFLTRVPPGTEIDLLVQGPEESRPQEIALEAEVEYDSLFQAIPSFTEDELTLPVEGQVLDESGLGYIRITTFSDDYNLTAQLWDRYINELLDYEVPGLILDLRVNGGGSSGLARDFAGYFFDEELIVSKRSYFNHLTGEFEYQDYPARIVPGPVYYDVPIAVLVSPYCVSACEGFSYSLTLRDNTIIVGHYPTAGAYGEVGRGQYDLPGDFSLQFPTGRSETPDGDLLIEGVGVLLDITVPVTQESALGEIDAVLEAAIQALLDQISP